MSMLLLVLLACLPDKDADSGDTDTDTSVADLSEALVDTGGCSDVFMWAASADQTWALWFSDDSDIARRAHDAGATLSESYDLAALYGHSPTVAVQHGEGLRAAFCNDVVEDYTVDQEWFGTGGLLTIAVTPSGDPEPWGEYPCEATLTLDDAVFTSTGVDPMDLGDFEFTVSVGWLPGR